MQHQIAQLEEEITLLIEQVCGNGVLFRRLLALQTELASANSLHYLLERLQLEVYSSGVTPLPV